MRQGKSKVEGMDRKRKRGRVGYEVKVAERMFLKYIARLRTFAIVRWETV